MKIHEYQAKELFRSASIPVPDGRAAFSVDEACEAAGVYFARLSAGGEQVTSRVTLVR